MTGFFILSFRGIPLIAISANVVLYRNVSAATFSRRRREVHEGFGIQDVGNPKTLNHSRLEPLKRL